MKSKSKETETSAILVRLITKKDKKRIKDEAKRLGMSAASFLRLLIKQYFDGIKFERDVESGIKK